MLKGAEVKCEKDFNTINYDREKEINKIYNKSGVRVFQRSFYDHIVRNRDDYHEIYKYIHENPIRWYFDKLYSEE